MTRKKTQPAPSGDNGVPNAASIAPAAVIDGDQVALRAYYKWTARGCPIGDDLRDWLEAEEELRRGSGPEP